ncbi:hypothetical protein [Nesterenkonia flava]|uniref:Uncharacterized protein n=1 Tax=Nesterenkonia flava TaxID=469799 RepID=A0ABU1FUW0_9MICC|nr:hypothetical protein [Nesterenkonia flava]MDR5712057.1 hypothetical protein [Nesterenkonia flava]
MASYLAADLIKPAVDRLRASRAQTRLLEYLIFRRALALSGGSGSQVVTGMASKPFQQAIQEWARIRPDDEPSPHFFNPFGTSKVKDGGFRTDKFPSNGASDTVAGWGSSMTEPPFVRVPGSKPMAFEFKSVASAELEKAFLRAESADPKKNQKPRLSDTAIWWLRARDLDALGIDDQSGLSNLVDILRREIDLTATEESALFNPALS